MLLNLTLVMYLGVNTLPYKICHHQIVFAKLNLTIFFFFFTPYKRLVWHYQQAITDLIKRAIELFDWEKSLSSLDYEHL